MDILIIKWLLKRKKIWVVQYQWQIIFISTFSNLQIQIDTPNRSVAAVKFHINFVQLVFPWVIFKFCLLHHNLYFPFSEILPNFGVVNHNCQHSWLVLQNLAICFWNNAPFALCALGQSVDRNNITRSLLSNKYLR